MAHKVRSLGAQAYNQVSIGHHHHHHYTIIILWGSIHCSRDGLRDNLDVSRELKLEIGLVNVG